MCRHTPSQCNSNPEQARDLTSAHDFEALVVATFSRQMALRLPDDSLVRARIKGKIIQPVCGDRVITNPLDDEPEWLITKILPRDNELTRPDSRGRTDVLAANLDFLAVVAADSPAVDWYIVDRYPRCGQKYSRAGDGHIQQDRPRSAR